MHRCIQKKLLFQNLKDTVLMILLQNIRLKQKQFLMAH